MGYRLQYLSVYIDMLCDMFENDGAMVHDMEIYHVVIDIRGGSGGFAVVLNIRDHI